MQLANKLMMLAVNVGDMTKSKEFYVDQLGFEISTEYRQDDNNWWVTLALPEGGTTMTLSRASVSPESIKSGTLAVYFETSDVDASYKDLRDKSVEVEDIQNDLFGPGSDVKWFSVKDPDGNVVFFAQKHDARAPF
jgi:catechol 2,3-dioxygenase-like lactoylglutathione lyase family enzyme